jgi:hypothetical protein
MHGSDEEGGTSGTRRRRSDSRKRQAQVAVRLDPDEFAILRDVAERDGQSLASALRDGFLSSAGARTGWPLPETN